MSGPGGIDVRRLGAGDEVLLEEIAPGVFDRPPRVDLLGAFLADPRHHLVIALEGRRVVGMATAVDYLHPDKPAELWIAELGVAPGHRGRGIGRRLLEALLEVGRDAGCEQAWVLTERGNRPARRLYRAVGGIETDPAQVLVEFSLAGEPRPLDPD